MHKIPAVPIALCWSAGILLWWLGAPWFTAVGFALVGCTAAVTQRFLTAFALWAVAAGFTGAQLHRPVPAPQWALDGETRSYAGTVTMAASSPVATSYVIRIDSAAANGRLLPVSPFTVYISTLPEWPAMLRGTTVRFGAALMQPTAEPQFDYDRDMRFFNLNHGISASAYVKEGSLHATGSDGSLAAKFAAFRSNLLDKLARTDLSYSTFALLQAVIAGDRSDLAPDSVEQFKASGVAHMLALSGLHVGIMIVLVNVLIFPLRFTVRLRKFRLFVACILVWMYVLAVGAPDSAVRAASMYSALVLALIANRGVNSYNALAFASLTVLAVRPFSLFSIGFLLSVSAVLGILIFAEKLNPVRKRNHTLHTAVSYVTVTIAATFGTSVVAMASLNNFAPWFIVTNIAVALLLPVFMTLGLVVLAFALMGFKAVWLCWLTNLVSDFIYKTAEFMSTLPGSNSMAFMSNTDLALMGIATVLAAVMINTPHRRLRSVCAAGAVACCAAYWLFAPKMQASEWFIFSDGSNTPIVMRHGHKAVVINTCRADNDAYASQSAVKRLDRWLRARHVDTLHFAHSDFKHGPFSRQGAVVTLDSVRMALFGNSSPPDTLAQPVRFALVCPGYRGTLAQVKATARTDSVMISKAVSPRRRRKLTATNSPALSLFHRTT